MLIRLLYSFLCVFILVMSLFRSSIYSQIQPSPAGTEKPAGSVQIALTEKTIHYENLTGFLADIDRVRSSYGEPRPENATTLAVPRSTDEVMASLVFSAIHESEEFKPQECADNFEYYAVIWKPVNGVRAIAPVDILFGIKGFDRTGTASPCVGRSGNWHQSFTIPSTASLPDYLLNR